MHVRTFGVTCDDLADSQIDPHAHNLKVAKQQSANPTTTIMKDPTTGTCASSANVSRAVKHAVNRIISEDEGTDCRRDENATPNGQVARPITKTLGRCRRRAPIPVQSAPSSKNYHRHITRGKSWHSRRIHMCTQLCCNVHRSMNGTLLHHCSSWEHF